MFWPRNTAKMFMQPGAVVGETNGLYAAILCNTNRGIIATKSPLPALSKRKVLRPRTLGPKGWAGS